VDIDPEWRVLDAGSGHAPHPRADVLLELLADDDSERSGATIDLNDARLVIGDACSMPFADKEFDYVLATHLAEHVDEPEQLCLELARVGRAGYIETPGWFGDILMRENFHKWRVRKRGEVLAFVEVNEQRPLGALGDVIYAVIYAGKERPGHTTLQARTRLGRLCLAALRYWIAGIFRLPGLVDLIYLRYEWVGSIPCRVERRTTRRATGPPSASGV